MARNYTIMILEKSLKVVECLARGEILEWKSVPEVAQVTGLTVNDVVGSRRYWADTRMTCIFASIGMRAESRKCLKRICTAFQGTHWLAI